MRPWDESASVRRVLFADAITCAAAGALMAFATGPLTRLTNLPEQLLGIAGAALFPVAALFAWMSTSRRLNRALLTVAVIGNVAWVAASLAVLALTSPAALGYVFVLFQAAAVAVLAALEARSLNRLPGLTAD